MVRQAVGQAVEAITVFGEDAHTPLLRADSTGQQFL
jgi:hypothetical protein